MIKKIILTLLVSILSFTSFYCESTDYEYTVFSIDGNEMFNPSLLSNEERIGQIANDYFEMKAKNDMLLSSHVYWRSILFKKRCK